MTTNPAHRRRTPSPPRVTTILYLVVLVLGPACKGSKQKTWERYDEFSREISPRVWGRSLSAKDAKRERPIFDCVWDGVSADDGDPAKAFDCWMRFFVAMTDCNEADAGVVDCVSQGHAVCEPSGSFIRNSERCRAKHGQPVRLNAVPVRTSGSP